MHFAAPPEGILWLPGQHGITYKPALLPEDAGASTSEGDENAPGPEDRRSSFQLDDGSVTADCSYSSSSTFWLGSTASSVRSRPASIFFGAGDVPSTPSGYGDSALFLAHSPCAKLPAGHPPYPHPAATFARRSAEFTAPHSAGSSHAGQLVSHASAACAALGPLLEDLPIQFCAARRSRSGQLDDRCGGGGGGASGTLPTGDGTSGVDSSVGAYEEDGTDADLDVELDDDSAHVAAGERKAPRGAISGGGCNSSSKAAPASYAAAVAAAAGTATSSPHTPHSAHRQHHAHGRHGAAAGGGGAAAGGAGAAASSAAAALLTAADLSTVAAAAAAAAASLGAGGKPAPWATTLMNRARAAEGRATRLEVRLREQRAATEELQRQLGERDRQLAALRAEVAALRRQQLLHSPQPVLAHAHSHAHSQLQAQLAAAGARLRSSSLGGAGAGAVGAAGGSFTGGSTCDGGAYGGGIGGIGGSYTCGGMVAAPPCYNAAIGPLAAAAAALTTPTTPEMHHHHHHHHDSFSGLHSSPSGDELGQLCDADRLSPPPRMPALSPSSSPSPPPEPQAPDLTGELGSTVLLPPVASLTRLDTPQVCELLPCYSASSTAAGAIAASASATGSFHLVGSIAGAAVAGPLPPVQEEEPHLAAGGLPFGSTSSARSSAAGDAACPVLPAAPAHAAAAAAAASPFAALAVEALHAEVDANAPPCRRNASSQSLLCVTASLPGGGLLQSPAELAAARRRTDAAHRALLVSASQAHRLAAALEAERAASEALREELRDWRSCCLDNHKELAAARRRLAVTMTQTQAHGPQ